MANLATQRHSLGRNCACPGWQLGAHKLQRYKYLECSVAKAKRCVKVQFNGCEVEIAEDEPKPHEAFMRFSLCLSMLRSLSSHLNV
jgi:hypothetical protein